MDPGSAGVAFVGFAASLVTLVAVVAKSSKVLYNLRSKFKDAPEDIRKLSKQFKVFQKLLDEFALRFQEPQDVGTLQCLQTLLELSVNQMQEDMDDFQVIVLRLQRLLKNSNSSMIHLRVRYHLDEGTVRKHQGRISTHIYVLAYIQSIVNERKLDAVLKNTRTAIDTTSTGFQAICSRLVAAEVLDFTRHGSYQQALGRIEERIYFLEDQLRVWHLSQGSSDQYIFNAGHHRSVQPARTTRFAYLTANSYLLPIGLLRIIISKRTQSRSPDRSRFSRMERLRISSTFTPPWWLSKIMLTATLEIYSTLTRCLPTISVSLTPSIINNHPLLIQYMTDFDLVGLQRLFSDGLARPTDLLPSAQWGGGPTSLPVFAILYGDHSISRRYKMCHFLFKNGAPLLTPSDTAMLYWGKKLTGDDIEDQDICRNLLQSYIINGGTAVRQYFDTRDQFLSFGLLRAVISLEVVQDCLFLTPEPWVPEDLVVSDVWLISTLAYTNESFKKLIRIYLDSYRSPFSITKKHHSDSTFESAFGIQKTVCQVKNALPQFRSEFWDLLSRWGDPSMFKPFVDGGIDVNEWGTCWIYLWQGAYKQTSKRHNAPLDLAGEGFQGLPSFLKPKELVPGLEQLLSAFLDDTDPLADGENDYPTFATMKSKKSFGVYYQALQIFLSDEYCRPWSLHGGADVPFYESYMYLALRIGHADAIQLILGHGAKVNVQIGNLFLFYEHMAVLRLYTWLTFAIERGDASCTEVLVKNGACIHSPDGLGRSALDLARLNVASAHPRMLKDYTFTAIGDSSTLTEDMETLAVELSPIR